MVKYELCNQIIAEQHKPNNKSKVSCSRLEARKPTLPGSGADQSSNTPEKSSVGLYERKRKMTEQPNIQPSRRIRTDMGEEIEKMQAELDCDNIAIAAKPTGVSKVRKNQKCSTPKTPEIKRVPLKRKSNQNSVGKSFKGGKSKTGGKNKSGDYVKKITNYFETISKQSSIVGGENFNRSKTKASTATMNIICGGGGGEEDTSPGQGVGGSGPNDLTAKFEMKLEDYCGGQDELEQTTSVEQ